MQSRQQPRRKPMTGGTGRCEAHEGLEEGVYEEEARQKLNMHGFKHRLTDWTTRWERWVQRKCTS